MISTSGNWSMQNAPSHIQQHTNAIIDMIRKQRRSLIAVPLISFIYECVAKEIELMKATGEYSSSKENDLKRWAEECINDITADNIPYQVIGYDKKSLGKAARTARTIANNGAKTKARPPHPMRRFWSSTVTMAKRVVMATVLMGIIAALAMGVFWFINRSGADHPASPVPPVSSSVLQQIPPREEPRGYAGFGQAMTLAGWLQELFKRAARARDLMDLGRRLPQVEAAEKNQLKDNYRQLLMLQGRILTIYARLLTQIDQAGKDRLSLIYPRFGEGQARFYRLHDLFRKAAEDQDVLDKTRLLPQIDPADRDAFHEGFRRLLETIDEHLNECAGSLPKLGLPVQDPGEQTDGWFQEALFKVFWLNDLFQKAVSDQNILERLRNQAQLDPAARELLEENYRSDIAAIDKNLNEYTTILHQLFRRKNFLISVRPAQPDQIINHGLR
ncbi:MAG: hypothetical protein HQK59_18355 [Deltaproteobacteria bacterium]|nr:hypothetical protein [Deltaproteobacteria bacterium]